MKPFIFILCLLAVPLMSSAQTPVRVTANRVNLRAKPQRNADVVGQVDYDTVLTAREIGEEWVEVEAPDSVELWVSKQYVQQPRNTIGANRVNVRAGSSINYHIVHTLPLGTVVEPRGEFQDWLKIAPPEGTHVWISKEYVDFLPADGVEEAASILTPTQEDVSAPVKKVRKPREKTAGAVEEVASTIEPPPVERVGDVRGPAGPTPIISPSVPVEGRVGRDIPVPPPADLKLIPLEGQGRIAEMEGLLRAAPLINEAPTRYRVVRWQNNRWQILCHVYGDASKFRALQDKRVRVKGREYWIQKAAAPVLIPDQIQEVESGE
ncbi:MAG: SH3 domain-containing protein [Verrucomicrobiota bacterium]|nr:SH3 domain-containing protein [Verrucomicrobiota bacterium]